MARVISQSDPEVDDDGDTLDNASRIPSLEIEELDEEALEDEDDESDPLLVHPAENASHGPSGKRSITMMELKALRSQER